MNYGTIVVLITLVPVYAYCGVSQKILRGHTRFRKTYFCYWSDLHETSHAYVELSF